MTVIASFTPIAGARSAPSFACVACGGTDKSRHPVLKARPERPFDLFRCGDCGLVQQHPRYSRAQLAGLHAETPVLSTDGSEHRWARAVQQYITHLASLEPARGRRLLDVGAGFGHLSALASRRGWRTLGIDANPLAVSEASRGFRLDFRAGAISSHRDTLGRFDVALVGDCIERDPNPVALLSDIRGLLNTGGTICIDTPNWGSRWRRLVRRHWLGLDRTHINLFDERSLARLLGMCGFSDVQLGSYSHYRYESWSARPEMQYLLSKLPAFLSRIINRLLERHLPIVSWLTLRRQMPQSLDEASAFIDRFSEVSGEVATRGASRDNLIATAIRVQRSRGR